MKKLLVLLPLKSYWLYAVKKLLIVLPLKSYWLYYRWKFSDCVTVKKLLVVLAFKVTNFISHFIWKWNEKVAYKNLLLNLVKLTNFRLYLPISDWFGAQTEFRPVPNQWENGKYNQIPVDVRRIGKYLRACGREWDEKVALSLRLLPINNFPGDGYSTDTHMVKIYDLIGDGYLCVYLRTLRVAAITNAAPEKMPKKSVRKINMWPFSWWNIVLGGNFPNESLMRYISFFMMSSLRSWFRFLPPVNQLVFGYFWLPFFESSFHFFLNLMIWSCQVIRLVVALTQC